MSFPDMDDISMINRQRSAEWHSEGEAWVLSDWSNAAAGEMGELANFVKKIRRLDTGTSGRYNEQDRDALVAKAMLEVADVYLYLDLLLEQLSPNATMKQVIATKFNITSEEYDFPHRIRVRNIQVIKDEETT